MKHIPQVINIDLINELKFAGKHKEVRLILKSFHKDVKNAGKQALKDYNNKTRRIKKHLKLCINLDCKNPALLGRVHCERCFEITRQNNKMRFDERKKDGICVRCGKRIASPGKNECKGCQEKQRVCNRKFKEIQGRNLK